MPSVASVKEGMTAHNKGLLPTPPEDEIGAVPVSETLHWTSVCQVATLTLCAAC